MSFWKKLKQVLPYVERGAVIAGEAQANPIGAALDTVNFIMAQKDASPQRATIDATKAIAVAVDDHEADIKALQQAVALMATAAARGDTQMLQTIAQGFIKPATPHMGEPLPPLPPSER